MEAPDFFNFEIPTKKRFGSHGNASFTAISRLSSNTPVKLVRYVSFQTRVFFILKGAVEQPLRHINDEEFLELLENFMEVEAVES